jgi:UDP-N-acetylglucosamine 2-epimerase (non-hydrolysing)
MGSKPRILHVVGARPNYMKVAPVHAALAAGDKVEQLLVHTGQHYDRIVNDVFFEELPLPEPDVRLNVGSGLHGEQTGRALAELERVFLEQQPDLVIVPGDVNSTLAGALAAAKLNIPVCHLEAGLRSFDWGMPEEHNRKLTDHLSSLLLTHSEGALVNLAAEGIPSERVHLIGNTMIDTLFQTIDRARALNACAAYGLERGNYVLVTLHRPALVDDSEMLARTMEQLVRVASRLPVLFPVHPRTRERLERAGLAETPIVLAPPQPYGEFLSLQADAAAVVTDSGGVQEETTALGIPCFTLRDNTERPVTVTHGTNRVLGLDPARIRDVPEMLAEHRTHSLPPLWDGHAGDRAARVIEDFVLHAAVTPIEQARERRLERPASAQSSA